MEYAMVYAAIVKMRRRFFCKLKEFRRIAMRAGKTDQRFSVVIHLAAAIDSR